MDRINKFISVKPTKNHRVIEHNNKQITITKKDAIKLRQYKQNRCLDGINLYQPLSTKWSSIKSENPINERKRKVNFAYQYERFVERTRNKKEHIKIDKNAIVDIWDDEFVLEGKHEIENFVNENNAIVGDFSSKRYKKEDLNDFIEKLKREYYKEIPRKTYKLEDLLPKIPKICETEKHFDKVAKTFDFEEKIIGFDVDKFHSNFAVAHKNEIILSELRNNGIIKIFECKDEIENVILGTKNIIIIHKKQIIIETLCNIPFVLNTSKQTQNNEPLWEDIKKKEEDKLQFMTFFDEKLIINHKNRIKDVILNKKESLLILITGKIIIIHDIINYKSSQPVKLKTEIPLKIKLGSNGYLYISTTNNFYVFDVKNKSLVCKIEGIINQGHTFSRTKNLVVIGDKENRLVILHENKIARVMEQEKKIIEIVCHKKYNFFCVAFKDEMILFYGKNGLSFECSIVKRINGCFRKLKFHDSLHWLYAVQNNQVLIFT
ncbi:hypothetical protein COBT_000859 [Conglomerata obtusa]